MTKAPLQRHLPQRQHHRLRAHGVQRRGGIRRRAQEGQETHADQPAKPLTDALKRQWAAGELSSRQVQELALTAGQQGAHSMERLGAAGKSGENPQHLQRALLSIFGRPAGAPPFTWVQVPLLINKKERLVPQPMLLPHLYFQSLFHHRHELWKATVEGVDAAGALRFWQNMRETAFVKQHPHLAEANWSAAIPFWDCMGAEAASISMSRSASLHGSPSWAPGAPSRSAS